MTPAFSIVLPTYNRAHLIPDALASVSEQRFRDFELIVVDDGSSDATRDLLAGRDDLTLLAQERSKGVAAARNLGLRRARGDLVAFLDSDDVWLPDHLSTLAELLSRHPTAVLATTSPWGRTSGHAAIEDAEVRNALPLLLITNHVGYTSCVAARRDAIAAAGGFDESMKVSSDLDLWLRLGLRSPFVSLSRRTVIVRRAADSLAAAGRRSGRTLDGFVASSERLAATTAGAPGRSNTSAWARGRLEFAYALAAIARGDDDSAAAHLRPACTLLPALSEEPAAVSMRIRFTLPDPQADAMLGYFERAARLWPDQRSDTAIALRGLALLRALGLGRVRLAWRLARGLPVANTARFAIRRRGTIARTVLRVARRDDGWRVTLRRAG